MTVKLSYRLCVFHSFSVSEVMCWRGGHTCNADLAWLRPSIFLEGMYSLIQFSVSLYLPDSLHGAFSLILCMRISLRNLHQCAGVGRRRHTHTYTKSRSVNWWSFVMGSDSLSLSLSASLAHAGSVSCYATCLCNQSHSHRKVAWLDEQIPLRTADVTAVLDPPQH